MKSHRLSGQAQLIEVERGGAFVRIGSRGDGVAHVQLVLHVLGYALPRSVRNGRPDGIYGPETEAATRRFQSEFGLQPDGVIGGLTLKALDGLLVERPCFDTASPGDYSAMIQARSLGLHAARMVFYT
ncbi:MAG TPA: peptidoglycan-binding domain-containing protein [Allosphingosinicella sp.]